MRERSFPSGDPNIGLSNDENAPPSAVTVPTMEEVETYVTLDEDTGSCFAKI